MPPANTPQIPTPNTTPPTHSPSARPLTPLSYLSSPVPDLAATLFTQAEADNDDENIRFLRAPLDTEMADAPPPDSIPTSNPTSTSDNRHRRLMRDLDRLRSRPLAAPEPAPSTEANFTPLLTHSPEQQRPERSQDADNSEDHTRRQRLQRVLARLNRLHDPNPTFPTSSYSERIPSPARQSLYDWAPAHEEGDEEEELEEILQELRRQQPGTHPEILRVLGRSQLDREREFDAEGLRRWRQSRNAGGERESLRGAAIMQHARNVRSPSGTERMLRYIRDRETGQGVRDEEEERERRATSRWIRATAGLNENSRYEHNRLAWQNQQRREQDVRARVDAYRRGYLAENPSGDRASRSHHNPPPERPDPTEQAINYLDRLRSSSSFEDSVAIAREFGPRTTEYFLRDEDNDFIMDVSTHPKPPPSSWLQPGIIFEGNQHTNPLHDSSASTFRPLGPHRTNADPAIAFDATRPWLSHNLLGPTPYHHSSGHQQDHWPVKVTLHAVDTERMTLAGTMEAYDVPNQSTYSLSSILSDPHHNTLPPPIPSTHSSSGSAAAAGTKKGSARHAPITTYLEGHIIDLETHTFRTPTTTKNPKHSYLGIDGDGGPAASHTDEIHFPPTSPATDASNWRKLPPFKDEASNDDVAQTMLSQSEMRELNREYVFMRWKERCFIHAKSDPCRLNTNSSTSPGAHAHAHPHAHSHSHTGAAGAGAGVVRLGEGDDSDTGHGLTISGFYYVSLRRSDGHVEGLYFDPNSSPYQCLRLEARRDGAVGAWGFV